MKRFIIASQIAVVLIFIIKIIFHAEVLQNTPLFSSLPLKDIGQAIAQTTANTPARAVKDVTDDGLKEERTLLALLQKKQKELDTKESSIKVEEEKVLALKKEIMEKIDALKALDAQLSSKLDAEQSGNTKRFKELAKIYEATPSQKAAAMMEKLETSTAALISINMKRDRAGLIWGFLSPQKAVEITREITRRSKTPSE